MGYQVEVQAHPFGTLFAYAVGSDRHLYLDLHSDQFSLNWTTEVGPVPFLELWPARRPRTSWLAWSAEGQFFQGDGHGLTDLIERAATVADIAFARLWLADVSVAWQPLEGSTRALAGVASDAFDQPGIRAYQRATGDDWGVAVLADVEARVRSSPKVRAGGTVLSAMDWR